MILQLEKNIDNTQKEDLISSLGKFTKSVSEVQNPKRLLLGSFRKR